MGGRPSWKMTGLQLQSVNSWFLPRWLVVSRQGYNDKYRGLVTVDFTLSVFSAANPVATAIWELKFLGGRPSWKATGLQLRSGNSRFGGGPSWKATGLQLQSGNPRLFGGWPSWKATGLQLQSANSWFFGGRRRRQLQLLSGN